jgi:hypothetical protein
MNGKLMLYVCCITGTRIFARTRQELAEKCGGGRISKMYRDTSSGVIHVGYVVGQHWFEAFRPVENPA